MELSDKVFTFLYEAEGNVHLLDPKTLEEHSISTKLVANNLLSLLEGGMEVKIRMRDGETPVLVFSPQQSFKCTVAKVLERRDCKPAVPLTV